MNNSGNQVRLGKPRVEKARVSGIYGPLVIGVFLTFLGLAWRHYPGYTWIYNDISYLGSPELNPQGWGYWAIGMAITGLLCIPIIFSLVGQMKEVGTTMKGWVRIGFILYLACAYGMIGLGLVPQFPGAVFLGFHIFHAVLAMGGLYLGTFCWGVVIFRHLLDNTATITPISKGGFLLTVVFGYGGPVGFLITQGVRLAQGGEYRDCATEPCPWYLAFSAWEWILFLCIFATFVVFWYLVPHLTAQKASKVPS